MIRVATITVSRALLAKKRLRVISRFLHSQRARISDATRRLINSPMMNTITAPTI
jgi:hypothetical protein